MALDLRFDWAARQAQGSTTPSLRPRQTIHQVALDAGMLAIEPVTLNGRTALTWVYDGGDRDGGLKVQLDRLYTPPERLTLRIASRTQWVNLETAVGRARVGCDAARWQGATTTWAHRPPGGATRPAWRSAAQSGA